jgi:hypothetical protein
MTTMINGRARKSLADQIDRLDRVLDGLANALDGAVVNAVREGVRQVLAEVLTDPALCQGLQMLAPEPTPAAVPAPSSLGNGCWRLVRWLGAGIRAIGSTICSVAVRCVQHVQAGVAWLWATAGYGVQGIKSLWTRVQPLAGFLCRLAIPMLTALVVGGLVGVAVYHASPWLAALTSGAGSFVSTLAVQVAWWLRCNLGSVFVGWSPADEGVG